MEFCPHCMKPSTGEYCRHCGGQMHWEAQTGQLPCGTLLSGSGGIMYQIGAAKGQGGFGITYAAMDLNNANRVAIKEYFPTRFAMRTPIQKIACMMGQEKAFQKGLRDFLKEAQMLAAVGVLPSVVSVIDFFEANGTAYLVMEYVEGIPLHQAVSARGKMPPEELLPMLPALLQDLDTLHLAGVIHRDISPDNLILMPDGTLKLIDFGSARSMGEEQVTVLLKPGFSPVEQYQSKGQGPYTDVYALAATLYYCLTGVIPQVSAERIMDDTLQGPNSLGAGLTHAQEKAILKGMTVQPKERPATAEAFRDLLFPELKNSKNRPRPVTMIHTTMEHPAQESITPKMPSTVPASSASRAPVTPEMPSAMSASSAKISPSRYEGVPHSRQEETSVGETPSAVAVETPTMPKSEHASTPAVRPAPKPFRETALYAFFMKNKKIFGIAGICACAVLIVTVIFSLFGGSGVGGPKESVSAEGFVYTEKDGYVSIIGYQGYDTNLKIPYLIDGCYVDSLTDTLFSEKKDVTSLTISANITNVGAFAFDGCHDLNTLVFEQGGNAAAWREALRSCKGIRCVRVSDQNSYNAWKQAGFLEDHKDAVLCYTGQITPGGKLLSTAIRDGLIYGLTDQNIAILLHLPDGVDPHSLSPSLGSYRVCLPDGGTPGIKNGVTAEGVVYTASVRGDQCTVTGYQGKGGEVEIPAEIDGIPVTTIAAKAFAKNSNITKITFPEQKYIIMEGAFEGCTKLEEIVFDGAVEIGKRAFADCKALSTLDLWGGAVVGEYAFKNCSNLISVMFFENSTVASLAFEDCGSLWILAFGGESVTNLAQNAFDGCNELRLGMAFEGAIVSEFDAPADYYCFYENMQVEEWTIRDIDIDDEVIYGEAEDENGFYVGLVVLDVHSVATRLKLNSETIWICADSLDGVSSSVSITLPDNCLFSAPLVNRAKWKYNTNTLAESWYFSCRFASEVVERSGLYTIYVDKRLTAAAMIRAEELATKYGYSRPDGDKWSTVFTEAGVTDWDFASALIKSLPYNTQVEISFEKELIAAAEEFALPVEEKDGKYYDTVAVGRYYDSDKQRLFVHFFTYISTES